MPDQKHARFGGHLAIVAVGSIGQGVLPLLLRHLDAARFAERDCEASRSPVRQHRSIASVYHH